MLLAQGLGLQDQLGGGAGTGVGPMVGRRPRPPVRVVAESEQVVDGAHGEAEALGQGLRRQPALAALQHRLSNGEGDGAWHSEGSTRTATATLLANGLNLPRNSLVQNLMANSCAKRYGR
jgi:hypothetical protein